MYDVVCFGELLIDFICSDVDVDLLDGQNFTKKAGGAPANVSAAIAKLGGNSAFVGKVGSDPFGYFLGNTLKEVGVDTSLLLFDRNVSTTLAFVSLKADGERDFVFNRGADELIHFNEIDLDKILDTAVLHMGSATALLGGYITDTYFELFKEAKKRGIFVAFDPNYRVNLWEDRLEEFVELSIKCFPFVDFVKVSEEELEIISGIREREEAVKKLHSFGADVVAVTLGSKGTYISNGEESRIIESVKVKSIDSTGAGDSFIGGALFKIARLKDIMKDYREITTLEEIIRFANRVGAIVCTKYGAISSLPTIEEVDSFGE